MKSSMFTAVAAIILLILFYPVQARGQVVNDDIEDRIELVLEQPRSSNTSNCTLQWECINKKATGKCIQYHNDQWFFFKNELHSKLFLNISGQACRDLRGVQLIVIDGTPCVPQTYKIIKCVSLGNHNDIFFELDDLEHNKTYLVQIDGYLHDFCEFEIELSSTPKGIPLQDDGIVPMQAEVTESQLIELQWAVTDSMASLIKTYEIWTRHESKNKSILTYKLDQGFNAYGHPRLQYAVMDSLQLYGTYHYHIVGVGDQDRILISKTSVHHRKPDHLLEKEKQWITIKLDYPDDCRLKILLFDTNRRELLNYFTFLYSAENQTFEININDYLEAGITDYRVQVEHLEMGTKQNYWIKKKRLE